MWSLNRVSHLCGRNFPISLKLPKIRKNQNFFFDNHHPSPTKTTAAKATVSIFALGFCAVSCLLLGCADCRNTTQRRLVSRGCQSQVSRPRPPVHSPHRPPRTNTLPLCAGSLRATNATSLLSSSRPRHCSSQRQSDTAALIGRATSSRTTPSSATSD